MPRPSYLRRLATLPLLGRLLLTAYRLRFAYVYGKTPARQFIRWLIRSREYTNFTYDLDPVNRRYLAAFVAQVVGQEFDTISRFIDELDADTALRAHLRQTVTQASDGRLSDPEMAYGRRLGWYAVTRASKPQVVVESGVDKGLGACVLTAALLRNRLEGSPGRYYGTDINPNAGYLLHGPYAEVSKVLYGDSVESLRAFQGEIDLFVCDSDHSPSYEANEYQAVGRLLTTRGIILSDNSHVTDELLKFARSSGRAFLFFAEKPLDHWYPGAGIGAAFPQPR